MSAHAYTAAPRERERTGNGAPGGVGRPLGIAAACALGLALVWVLAALVPATHAKDAVVLYEFTRLDSPAVQPIARVLVLLLQPLLFVLGGIALVAFALAQERPRVAAAVATVMVLAPLSGEVLKRLAAHPHAAAGGFLVSADSWPSGHSTAALALVLSCVLVSPPRWRRLVAGLGALYVLGVAVGLLILAVHMPSDVLGGLLLATLWMALAVAALRAAERRWPTARAARYSSEAGAEGAWWPGAHSGSSEAVGSEPALAARASTNSRSESRLR
jgi:membrane-associated phospholipid phosphatase